MSETNLNEKAKLLADAYWTITNGEVCDNLHVYVDGCVVQIVGTSDQHLEMRENLIKEQVGFGEARVMRVSIFVVPYEEAGRLPLEEIARLAGPMIRWADHRQEDVFRLEDTYDQAEYLLALTKG